MNEECKHNAPPVIKEDGLYCRICGKKLESFNVKELKEMEKYINERK